MKAEDVRKNLEQGDIVSLKSGIYDMDGKWKRRGTVVKIDKISSNNWHIYINKCLNYVTLSQISEINGSSNAIDFEFLSKQIEKEEEKKIDIDNKIKILKERMLFLKETGNKIFNKLDFKAWKIHKTLKESSASDEETIEKIKSFLNDKNI
jgi:hypothetical protein